ncbi:MAG TPA: hypothetical protein PLP34_08225, partial [Chitinophagaceae bacterium]|nr:hypothetical protein [Chitinophagaceae bacterium]
SWSTQLHRNVWLRSIDLRFCSRYTSMIFLLISILLNTYLGVSFRVFSRFGFDLFQTIVFNYAFCVISGCIFSGHWPVGEQTLHQEFFPWALLMGALFISVFNLIAWSSLKTGVTITQSANRLSLVIPVLFAILFLNEQMSALKAVGVLLAIPAVILVSKKSGERNAESLKAWEYLIPFILFISSGVIDTLTKFVQQGYLRHDADANSYLILGFMSAFVIGLLALVYLVSRGRKKFHPKNLLSGMLLGIPNYFSIFFLVKALQSNALSSSAIIPINNIGVLFLSAIIGMFIFKERLSRLNLVGLFCTLLAIFFIFLGDTV